MAHRFPEDRYGRMHFNRCGRSGLLLPRLSLGAWHNFQDLEKARTLMTRAFEQGITHLDLANNYGPPPGAAEANVGRILRDDFADYRDELIIATKAGYRHWPGPYGDGGSRKYIIASCERSLQRTGLDYFDIFYSHRPDPDTPFDETMGALEQLVRQGKALYVGISSYNGPQTRDCYDLLTEAGTKLTIHQPAYNMINRGIEADLLPVADELGIGVIVFCPLAQGLLTTKYLDGIPQDSRAASGSQFLKPDRVTPELVDQARRLNEIAQRRGQSLAQMAITWVHRDGRITSALFGASKPEQIDELVQAAAAEPLSDEELRDIDAILGQG